MSRWRSFHWLRLIAPIIPDFFFCAQETIFQFQNFWLIHEHDETEKGSDREYLTPWCYAQRIWNEESIRVISVPSEPILRHFLSSQRNPGTQPSMERTVLQVLSYLRYVKQISRSLILLRSLCYARVTQEPLHNPGEAHTGLSLQGAPPLELLMLSSTWST